MCDSLQSLKKNISDTRIALEMFPLLMLQDAIKLLHCGFRAIEEIADFMKQREIIRQKGIGK